MKIKLDHIKNGMTDKELENYSRRDIYTFRPTSFWTVEHNSIGVALRNYLDYPFCLPILAYSDHGVHLSSKIRQHELNNKAKIYITWNSDRLKELQRHNKKSIFIVNPYVLYRKKNGYKKLNDAKGLLVFLAHDAEGITWKNKYNENYFNEIKKIANGEKILLCLHSYDIKKGLHKKLRKFDIPIVTAGNTESIDFIDNFYKIISNFDKSCSNVYGSQLAYCHELGLKYKIIKKHVALRNNLSDKNIKIGINTFDNLDHEKLNSYINTLFSSDFDSRKDEKDSLVCHLLGLNGESDAKVIKSNIVSQLKRNPHLIVLVVPGFIKSIYRYLFK